MRQDLRKTIPQAITTLRVCCGAAALFSAHFGEARTAATLITLGSITDGIDGPVARRLGVTSEFGAMYDYFADYLCYVAAPAVLSLILIKPPIAPWMLVLLGLPLLAGAIRYPRNLIYKKTEDFEATGSPGLGTVFYAYFLVTVTFTGLDSFTGDLWFNRIVLTIVAVVSCLMVSGIRYLKTPGRHLFAGLLIGLAVMPFVFTRLLAAVALACGFVFAFVSPLSVLRRPWSAGNPLRNSAQKVR